MNQMNRKPPSTSHCRTVSDDPYRDCIAVHTSLSGVLKIETISISAKSEVFHSRDIQVVPVQLSVENGGVPFRMKCMPFRPAMDSEDAFDLPSITYFVHALDKPVSIQQFEVLYAFQVFCSGTQIPQILASGINELMDKKRNSESPRVVYGQFTLQAHHVGYFYGHLNAFFDEYAQNTAMTDERHLPDDATSSWWGVIAPLLLSSEEVQQVRWISEDSADHSLAAIVRAHRKATSRAHQQTRKTGQGIRKSRPLRKSSLQQANATNPQAKQTRSQREQKVARKSSQQYKRSLMPILTLDERDSTLKLSIDLIENDKEKGEFVLRVLQHQAPAAFAQLKSTNQLEDSLLSDNTIRALHNVIHGISSAVDITIEVKQENITADKLTFIKKYTQLLPCEKKAELTRICTSSIPSMRLGITHHDPNIQPSSMPENVQLMIYKYVNKHLPEDVKKQSCEEDGASWDMELIERYPELDLVEEALHDLSV